MPAAATYELRQRLLRPHQTVEELQRLDEADAEYFAAMTDDTVVATATVRRESCPWEPQRTDSWRLRGMATEPAYRGQGLGRQVLNAAVAHIASSGGGLVWCNARTPALSFYTRAGFVPYGDEWDEPLIGPHVRMWREVTSAQGG